MACFSRPTGARAQICVRLALPLPTEVCVAFRVASVQPTLQRLESYPLFFPFCPVSPGRLCAPFLLCSPGRQGGQLPKDHPTPHRPMTEARACFPSGVPLCVFSNLSTSRRGRLDNRLRFHLAVITYAGSPDANCLLPGLSTPKDLCLTINPIDSAGKRTPRCAEMDLLRGRSTTNGDEVLIQGWDWAVMVEGTCQLLKVTPFACLSGRTPRKA